MSALERVRPSEPHMPVSPQLAMRVAVLGALAMAMFLTELVIAIGFGAFLLRRMRATGG